MQHQKGTNSGHDLSNDRKNDSTKKNQNFIIFFFFLNSKYLLNKNFNTV